MYEKARRKNSTRVFRYEGYEEPQAFKVGDRVEWYEGKVLLRGHVVEVVAPTARPQTPGVDVTSLCGEQSYVVQAGRVTKMGHTKQDCLRWPRCVRLVPALPLPDEAGAEVSA